MNKTIRVVNGDGVPFTVEMAYEYGVGVLNVYDARYTKGYTKYGQRAVTYVLDVFMGLEGGEQFYRRTVEWNITDENVLEIQKAVKSWGYDCGKGCQMS